MSGVTALACQPYSLSLVKGRHWYRPGCGSSDETERGPSIWHLARAPAIRTRQMRCKRQDVAVAEHSQEDLEALHLSLGQVVASPDVWRARAVSAGGFLGAAAAFSLWGLSQQAATFDGLVITVAGTAAVSYVLAVVAFLVASVLPTPKANPDVQGSLADQVEALAHKETKPIKYLVLTGAGLGTLAITATTVGSFLVLLGPVHSSATVSFVGREFWSSVETLCPDLTQPFKARLTEDGSGYVRLRIVDDGCGTQNPELVVPRSEIVLLKPEFE